MVKTTKIVILLFCGFFLLNCNIGRSDFLTKEELIKKISEEESADFSQYSFIFLFCQMEDGTIGIIDPYGLSKIYNNQKIVINYAEFVTQCFTTKGIIKCYDVYDCFIVNDTVRNVYKDGNFLDFMNHYSENFEENEITIKTNLSKNTLYSVMYYFFQHNYFSSYDDVSGHYYVERISYY